MNPPAVFENLGGFRLRARRRGRGDSPAREGSTRYLRHVDAESGRDGGREHGRLQRGEIDAHGCRRRRDRPLFAPFALPVFRPPGNVPQLERDVSVVESGRRGELGLRSARQPPAKGGDKVVSDPGLLPQLETFAHLRSDRAALYIVLALFVRRLGGDGRLQLRFARAQFGHEAVALGRDGFGERIARQCNDDAQALPDRAAPHFKSLFW